MRFRLVVDGDPHELDVTPGRRGLTVQVDGVPYRVDAKPADDAVEVRIGRKTVRVRLRGDRAEIGGRAHRVAIPEVVDVDERPVRRESAQAARSIEVRPPMPGRIVRLLAQPGTRVKRGQVLVVLEAMKMQNEIPAPADGVVREVHASEGESVSADRVVLVLEAR